MTKPLQIQILKKGDRYAVRSKGLFGLWWYHGIEGCWLWHDSTDWTTKELAEQRAANLRQWDADQRAFKAAPTEIVP